MTSSRYYRDCSVKVRLDCQGVLTINKVSGKKEGQKIYAGLNFWSVGYSLTYGIYLMPLYGGTSFLNF